MQLLFVQYYYWVFNSPLAFAGGFCCGGNEDFGVSLGTDRVDWENFKKSALDKKSDGIMAESSEIMRPSSDKQNLLAEFLVITDLLEHFVFSIVPELFVSNLVKSHFNRVSLSSGG